MSELDDIRQQLANLVDRVADLESRIGPGGMPMDYAEYVKADERRSARLLRQRVEVGRDG